MKKALLLNQVVGAVALSYLVIIPASVYVLYKMIKEIEEDMEALGDFDRTQPLQHLRNLICG